MSFIRSILLMMSGGKKSRSSPVPDEKLLPETAEPVQADQDEPSTMPNAENMNIEMENPQREENIPTEMKFLTQLIRARLDAYFSPDVEVPLPEVPAFEDWNLPLGKFILENKNNVSKSI